MRKLMSEDPKKEGEKRPNGDEDSNLPCKTLSFLERREERKHTTVSFLFNALLL